MEASFQLVGVLGQYFWRQRLAYGGGEGFEDHYTEGGGSPQSCAHRQMRDARDREGKGRNLEKRQGFLHRPSNERGSCMASDNDLQGIGRGRGKRRYGSLHAEISDGKSYGFRSIDHRVFSYHNGFSTA